MEEILSHPTNRPVSEAETSAATALSRALKSFPNAQEFRDAAAADLRLQTLKSLTEEVQNVNATLLGAFQNRQRDVSIVVSEKMLIFLTDCGYETTTYGPSDDVLNGYNVTIRLW